MSNPGDLGDLTLTLHIPFCVIGFVLLAFGHVQATKSHLRAGLWQWAFQGSANPAPQKLEIDRREQRFQVELMQARAQNLKYVHALSLQLVFFWTLAEIWKVCHDPSLAAACKLLAPVVAYGMHLFCYDTVHTEDQFRKFRVLVMFIHSLFAAAVVLEKDLVVFDLAEKMATISLICSSVTLIDLKVILPFYACQSAVLTWCRWNLIGLGNMTTFVVFASIATNAFFGAVMVFCVHQIRSSMTAKLDSGDASALMMGFRQVLRGVCDGDVVLDRCTMTIVDDATCLQRVLKCSKNLSSSNFLDLFLDTESRDRFQEFLAQDTQDGVAEGLPRGLRVSLQGAQGAVSMDLFYTTLPRGGDGSPRASSDYCLLAMKEDPEQSLPEAEPAAQPGSVPGVQRRPSSQRSRSSVSEVVMAYDDLLEIALLVSDATGFLDICEVHLSFQRQSEVSNIESEMPTLRRFIRASDWDRIERMFDIVTNLPPEDQQQRCFFRRPTLFRIPGESRSYVCARSTSLRLADQCITPGRPNHFWMHLTQFDSSRIQRPRDQELEGIAEE
eukprot:s279_g35.t1